MRLLALTFLVHTAAGVVAAQTPLPPRREPVTPELERSAFADPRARTILARARVARLTQDSALGAYDAKTYLRLSVGMAVRRFGPERLLFRTEQASHVQWGRASGLTVEPTGRRSASPMGSAFADMTQATPVPYFPGRESLWLPYTGVAKADVNENELLHPLATGAEAYYQYASGDSLSIHLPDGRAIALRELRITARRADWRAFVGSFWFDLDRGNLVRAAYRLSADIDVWDLTIDDMRRQMEELEKQARSDTSAVAQRARREMERLHMNPLENLGLKLLQGTFTPVRGRISAITVEYALYQGRFWLPKLNIAEGQAEAGFVRMPIRWEESFRYNDVSERDTMQALRATALTGRAEDDSAVISLFPHLSISLNTPAPPDTSAAARAARVARVAREDYPIPRFNYVADSLHKESEKRLAAGDSAGAKDLAMWSAGWAAGARQIRRRLEDCAHDSSWYAGIVSRYDGALRMALRLPCDYSRLANSPDLPGSIYDSGDELFGTGERDALLQSLNFSLQPGWAPQWPTFQVGLGLSRYNRIEGFSPGASATASLGFGYSAQVLGRIGTGDKVANGELSLSSSNGRTEVRLGVFHRLAVANDDWGTPLSVGASLANLLYAHDEGFYYRAWGAELSGTRAALSWRAFAERQYTAGREPNTQASLANLFADPRFERNIEAIPLTSLGLAGELARTFGNDPTVSQFFTRARIEGAFTRRGDSVGSSGSSGYGRLVVDGTFTRRLGSFDGALTGAGGASAGQLPLQRAFYVGGLQTVRGQFARPEGAGRVGDAFWLARAEAGPHWPSFRPTVFYDLGCAGKRTDVARLGRPLSGAGVGLSMLDALVRIDAARGIWPERRWRWDIHLGARF